MLQKFFFGIISGFGSWTNTNNKQDTGNSRYFVITEFNNCFIVRSPSLFFTEHLWGAKRSAFFHARAYHAWFRLRISRILSAAKHSWMTLRMSRPLFFRQLFEGHVVGFQPMKRKKNLQRMIISNIVDAFLDVYGKHID